MPSPLDTHDQDTLRDTAVDLAEELVKSIERDPLLVNRLPQRVLDHVERYELGRLFQ